MSGFTEAEKAAAQAAAHTAARGRQNGRAPDQRPWPEPLSDKAFHGVAGEIALRIEPHTEADIGAVLMQMLVAFGSAAHRRASLKVEGDTHHPNEFLGIVGRTSHSRKGTSWGRARQHVEHADETWPRCVVGGLSSGEGLIWHVRDRIVKRRKAKKKEEKAEADADGYITEEVDPGASEKRLCAYEPELASVLGRMGRDGNPLSAVLRQAWDGSRLAILTKNSPCMATDAHVSVIAHITEEELRRTLTATETANGFGNRFLWYCARRSKELPLGSDLTYIDWPTIQQPMRDAITWVCEHGADIGLSPEAREAWVEAYPALTADRKGMFGAITSRAEAHVRRLALIYAILDRSTAVSLPHLDAALACWDYCDRSASYLFGGSLGDPLADQILAHLRSRDQVTRTQLSGAFARHKSSEEIQRALGVLVEAGLAGFTTEQTGGRPTEVWRALP